MRKLLTVEDTFFIDGRGTVITGWIDEEPNLKLHDSIEIVRPDKTVIMSEIAGIDQFRVCFGEVTARKKYGISLKTTLKLDVPRYSIVFMQD